MKRHIIGSFKIIYFSFGLLEQKRTNLELLNENISIISEDLFKSRHKFSFAISKSLYINLCDSIEPDKKECTEILFSISSVE